MRWIRPSGLMVLIHINAGRFSGLFGHATRLVEPARPESVFRRARPDLPRGHSRIGARAQDTRHDVRTIASNNLLPPSVRHRFTRPIHRDEALLTTKRRHTAADRAHG